MATRNPPKAPTTVRAKPQLPHSEKGKESHRNYAIKVIKSLDKIAQPPSVRLHYGDADETAGLTFLGGCGSCIAYFLFLAFLIFQINKVRNLEAPQVAIKHLYDKGFKESTYGSDLRIKEGQTMAQFQKYKTRNAKDIDGKPVVIKPDDATRGFTGENSNIGGSITDWLEAKIDIFSHDSNSKTTYSSKLSQKLDYSTAVYQWESGGDQGADSTGFAEASGSWATLTPTAPFQINNLMENNDAGVYLIQQSKANREKTMKDDADAIADFKAFIKPMEIALFYGYTIPKSYDFTGSYDQYLKSYKIRGLDYQYHYFYECNVKKHIMKTSSSLWWSDVKKDTFLEFTGCSMKMKVQWSKKDDPTSAFFKLNIGFILDPEYTEHEKFAKTYISVLSEIGGVFEIILFIMGVFVGALVQHQQMVNYLFEQEILTDSKSSLFVKKIYNIIVKNSTQLFCLRHWFWGFFYKMGCCSACFGKEAKSTQESQIKYMKVFERKIEDAFDIKKQNRMLKKLEQKENIAVFDKKQKKKKLQKNLTMTLDTGKVEQVALEQKHQDGTVQKLDTMLANQVGGDNGGQVDEPERSIIKEENHEMGLDVMDQNYTDHNPGNDLRPDLFRPKPKNVESSDEELNPGV